MASMCFMVLARLRHWRTEYAGGAGANVMITAIWCRKSQRPLMALAPWRLGAGLAQRVHERYRPVTRAWVSTRDLGCVLRLGDARV